ncbi:MAG: My1 [Cyanobacteria bacterium RYN_339]|nr:My1 [Cyanobacteria bacterium RYN_339]
MPTETISLTRALAEVKTLEDRIQKAILTAKFIDVVQGAADTPVDRAFRSKEELASRIQGDFQSIEALAARRAAMKAAITKANVVTLVKVGERTLTIADAVALKQSLFIHTMLLEAMKQSQLQGTRQVEVLAKQLDEKIERLVQNSFQNVSKVSEEQFQSVRKPQADAFEPKLLDPLRLNDKIRALEEQLDDIQLNLDFALSEVNARTDVEISY